MPAAGNQILLTVRDYDLDATLSSGQAFRWEFVDGAWEGVIGERWVRLRTVPRGILAEAAAPGGGLDRSERATCKWTWIWMQCC